MHFEFSLLLLYRETTAGAAAQCEIFKWNEYKYQKVFQAEGLGGGTVFKSLSSHDV